DHETPHYTIVVLHERAVAQHRKRVARISESLDESRRVASLVGVETRKRERAREVRALVAVVVGGIDAGTERHVMLAGSELKLVFGLQRAPQTLPLLLRTATRKRVEHANSPRV